MIRRLFAAALGVLLGLAAVQPIQAARFASAACSNDVAGVYEHLQYRGWTYLEVEQAASGSKCQGSSIRGFYFAMDGNLRIITRVGVIFYILEFDPFGQLQSVE